MRLRMHGAVAAQIVTNEAGLSGELVFAVTHVYEMLTTLKTNYYAAWHDEKQRDAP